MPIQAGYEIKASWGVSPNSVAANAVTMQLVRTNTTAAADAACGAQYNKLVADGKNQVIVWASPTRLVDAANQP